MNLVVSRGRQHGSFSTSASFLTLVVVLSGSLATVSTAKENPGEKEHLPYHNVLDEDEHFWGRFRALDVFSFSMSMMMEAVLPTEGPPPTEFAPADSNSPPTTAPRKSPPPTVAASTSTILTCGCELCPGNHSGTKNALADPDKLVAVSTQVGVLETSCAMWLEFLCNDFDSLFNEESCTFYQETMVEECCLQSGVPLPTSGVSPTTTESGSTSSSSSTTEAPPTVAANAPTDSPPTSADDNGNNVPARCSTIADGSTFNCTCCNRAYQQCTYYYSSSGGRGKIVPSD